MQGQQLLQGFRLSPQQRRLWLLARGGVPAGGSILIEGALAPDLLAGAVAKLVGRHEILRTRFRRLAGMPMPLQVIADHGVPVLERIDLRGMTPEEQGAAVDRAFHHELARPFDLEAGPVLRTSLLELSPKRHFLLATLCPLCGDGWTLAELVRELVDSYEVCLHGGPKPEEAFRYLQFSDWQNALLDGERDEEVLRFWQEREPLAPGLPFRLSLDGEPPIPTSAEPAVVVELAPSEVAAAKEVARRQGFSIETLFLACWQALLARLTAEPRVVVGELYSFRDDDLLANAFGLFAKYLPVLSRCAGELRFTELLAEVEEERERVHALADSLVWSGGERLDDGQPQAIPYGFEIYEWPETAAAGAVTFTLTALHAAADRCELELSCRRTGHGWMLALSYDSFHFDRRDVEALARQLSTLIRSAIAAPEGRLSALEILHETERRQILVAQSSTATAFSGALVHELFAEQAAWHPKRTAVVVEDRTLTYGDLDRRANRLARGLRQSGIGPDALVALCVERSLEMIVGLLGILKAGGAYVPIDPEQPRRRLARILDELGAGLLLTQEHLAAGLAGGRARVISLDPEVSAFSALPDTDPGVPVASECLAYVVFTSGSTGRPKGVAVEHRQLRNYVQGVVERLGLPPGASFATVSTFAADLGNTMIFPALTTGGSLHLVIPDRATDPAALGELFRRHGIDCLKIVPSHLEVLLGGTEPAAVLPRRRLVLGGEALGWPLADELRRLAPEGCGIFNHYGPSETTVGVAVHPVSGRSPRDPRCATVPIGTPLPNSRIYVLDANFFPVPEWLPGDLYVGGDGISRGYLRDPASTAGSFVPSPFGPEPGSRLYRTGDLGRRLPEGAIEFLGRHDHQIKLHGFRLELGEIQAALNEHPGVRDSRILTARDEDGRDVLIAYYLSRQELDSAALREHLRGRVLEAAIPGYFHHLQRLPLTLNGKLNVKALPGLAEVKASVRRTVVPPRTSVEEILAGMWAELLRLPAVGAADNFFELGGHSLLVTQVISQVRKVFAVELPLRSLFEAPSVEGFAARVESALRAGHGLVVPPIEPVSRQGELPLSFAQERLWIMHQLDPDSPAYNIPLALGLAGPLRVPELLGSLREVERRHEILRTTFPAVDGQPRQSISPLPLSRPAVVDLGALDGERQETEALRLTRQEAQRPFSLARGPLLRLTLLTLGRESYRLLFTLHHIVSDAWSMDVLVREVTVVYGAFSEGRPSPLPSLSLQYADFADWQRRWLEAGGLEPQLAYWHRQLSGAPELLALPGDRPRLAVRTFAGGAVIKALSPGLASPLRELSRREGVTLFMTLLAAFDVLLLRATGQEDLVVGTDIANRNHLETEGLIGFFVNNLALRTSLAGDPTFRELLARVRDVALGAYTHQDLPFDRLVKELAPKRALDRTPMFQVLFVHQNAPASALELADLQLSGIQDEVTMSKFDLALFVREVGNDYAAVWIYSADLFDRPTIERLARQFERLLASILEDPDRRVSAFEVLSEEEQRQQRIERAERQDEKSRRIRSVQRQSVDLEGLSIVRTGLLVPGTSLPLLVQPASGEIDLLDWAIDNREFLETELLRYGALLFRGAEGISIADFERFARSFTPDLCDEYEDLPGEEQGEKALPFHNESSHLHRWPLKQWFFCVTAPGQGGETPIVDCRKIYRALAPEVLAAFAGKGLLYERNFIPGVDVAWQDFFGRDSREAVEDYCRGAGIHCEWRGDRLRTRQLRPAVARHPKSGEPIFFNQLMLYHVSCLEPELRESVPRNVYYGDGRPIDDAVVTEITRLYWDLAVRFPWQEGDILVVDNMLVAHARNSFEGPRKIVVAMGEMFGKDQLS